MENSVTWLSLLKFLVDSFDSPNVKIHPEVSVSNVCHKKKTQHDLSSAHVKELSELNNNSNFFFFSLPLVSLHLAAAISFSDGSCLISPPRSAGVYCRQLMDLD